MSGYRQKPLRGSHPLGRYDACDERASGLRGAQTHCSLDSDYFAHGQRRYENTGCGQGVSEFVAKPLNNKDLLNRVQIQLRNLEWNKTADQAFLKMEGSTLSPEPKK